MHIWRRSHLLLYSLGVLACAGEGHDVLDPLSGDPAQFEWTLRPGYRPPVIPADNPMSAAKVELGRRLFYDVRLSGNGGFACSSCHRQELAFSDAKNVPIGSTGEAHTRNSMSLSNIGYQRTFGWADPGTLSLEAQARIPMFGTAPVELGLLGREADVLSRLRREPVYQQLFPKAFGRGGDPFSIDNVTRAVAAFERTFISVDAPYDRWRHGNSQAISTSAVRGANLFDRVCGSCHGGSLLTAATWDPGLFGGGLPTPAVSGPEFVNNGLYNIGGTGAYPPRNGGLFEHTRLAADRGRMKIPSLRNVSVTFPYMHDGSLSTLSDVIDHYARGGRLISSGPFAGDGALSPAKDGRVAGFRITATEKNDLLAFLQTLTDSTFLTDPRLSNPWR